MAGGTEQQEQQEQQQEQQGKAEPQTQTQTQPPKKQQAQGTTGDRIQEGACLPLEEIKLYVVAKDGSKTEPVSGRDLFLGKRVVVIAIPGAFTPVCSSRHVPGYVEKVGAIKGGKGGKGKVDEVYCIAGNDAFVMSAWGKSFGSDDVGVTFLADQDHSFAKATGLGIELFGAERLKRFSMLVEDGVVKSVNVEKEHNDLGISSADHMLEVLGQ